MRGLIPILLLLCLAVTTTAKAQYSSSNKKAVRHFERAVKALEQGNRERAIQLLQEGLQADSAFAEAHLQLADIFMDQHHYVAAAQHYQAFLRHDQRHKRWIADARKGLTTAQFRINALQHPVDFNPKNMGPAVNSADDDYLPAITADDSTLVFTRRSPRRASTTATTPDEEDFYICRRIPNDRWSTAYPMPYPVNSNDNEGAECLSYDGSIMIFTACGRPDGSGRCDLYQCVWHGLGWGTPRNMGPVLNTGHWESQPTLSRDGKTLIFVSDRPGGFGGTDLWISHQVDGIWATPQNLGSTINTPGNESGPFLYFDDSTLYFVSNGHIGMGGFDIFLSRRLPDGSWDTPVNLGYPINTEGDESRLVVSANGRTAYFASDRWEGMGKNDIYWFDLPEALRGKEVECPTEIASADTLVVGQSITLHNIFFLTGSYQLIETSLVELDKVAELLIGNPTLRIRLEGHTDNVGDHQLNQALSERRAQAAHDYLLVRGIEPERLEYKGYGESRPIADNGTEEGRRMNRRTVFTIIEK